MAPFFIACASAPFPRETRADNARTDDPWLTGDMCSDATPQDAAFKVEDVAEGSGKPVERGETVRVHYVAKTADGTTLHNTHDGGPPIEIIAGSTKTICGFERAIVGMKPGAQRRAFVPYALAFGEAGRADVPPKTDVVFVIDLWVPADRELEQKGGPVRPSMPGRRR
jgi:hypothetical protein